MIQPENTVNSFWGGSEKNVQVHYHDTTNHRDEFIHQKGQLDDDAAAMPV